MHKGLMHSREGAFNAALDIAQIVLGPSRHFFFKKRLASSYCTEKLLLFSFTLLVRRAIFLPFKHLIIFAFIAHSAADG